MTNDSFLLLSRIPALTLKRINALTLNRNCQPFTISFIPCIYCCNTSGIRIEPVAVW